MNEQTVASTKRPKKELAIFLILNQFASLQGGIPGVTLESCKAVIERSNCFLYVEEAKSLIIEQMKSNPSFPKEVFVQFLKDCSALREGQAPHFGDNPDLIRIDSLERAQQVAKDPADATKINELMKQIVILAKQVNPLVKGGISVALKNPKKKKVAAEATDPKE